jgi:hypothetical protein
MKTKLFYLCLGVITLTMVSCETENNSDSSVNNVAAKQNVVVSSTNESLPDFSPCVTTDLLAARRFDAGEFRVYFDAEKVYVEYQTNEDWFIRETRLYIGDQVLTPVNRRGEPVPANYPMGGLHPDGEQNIVYSISKHLLPKCFSISANAQVYRVQDGEIVLVETAWARGERFTQTSWGMFFDVCQSDCNN